MLEFVFYFPESFHCDESGDTFMDHESRDLELKNSETLVESGFRILAEMAASANFAPHMLSTVINCLCTHFKILSNVAKVNVDVLNRFISGGLFDALEIILKNSGTNNIKLFAYT